MNKFLSLLTAFFFAVTSLAVEAATPKAAESENSSVAVTADAPKPKAEKVAPSDARPTKQAKSTKTNKKGKKTKKSKKPKQVEKPAANY